MANSDKCLFSFRRWARRRKFSAQIFSLLVFAITVSIFPFGLTAAYADTPPERVAAPFQRLCLQTNMSRAAIMEGFRSAGEGKFKEERVEGSSAPFGRFIARTSVKEGELKGEATTQFHELDSRDVVYCSVRIDGRFDREAMLTKAIALYGIDKATCEANNDIPAREMLVCRLRVSDFEVEVRFTAEKSILTGLDQYDATAWMRLKFK